MSMKVSLAVLVTHSSCVLIEIGIKSNLVPYCEGSLFMWKVDRIMCMQHCLGCWTVKLHNLKVQWTIVCAVSSMCSTYQISS